MEKMECEKIIKDTIEYANQEIEKTKKKSRGIIGGILVSIVAAIVLYLLLFVKEFPIKYSEGIVTARIPVDEGIDVTVHLPNYKRANAVLVKNGEDSYDLYIGINQTVVTKLLKDNDDSDHLLRVGNGIIVDYQSERLLFHIPGGFDETAIQRIYYVDDFSEKIMALPDEELKKLDNKTLVWERK